MDIREGEKNHEMRHIWKKCDCIVLFYHFLLIYFILIYYIQNTKYILY